MTPRLNYSKTFLLGFGFFGVNVVWGIYNAFVPIFLADKFHISPALIGLFMTFDNIAALFIQPPIGRWSDRLRTPLGRRIPFILVGAPISAVAFGLIPLAAALPVFVACTSTLILSAAIWRTPAVALMPDITPSQYRSQANGIINFMGGIGTIIALQVGGALFDVSPNFPFWLGTLLVLLTALVLILFIREPKEYEAAPVEDPTPTPSTGFFDFIRDNTLVSLFGLFVAAGITALLGVASPALQTAGGQFGLPPLLVLGGICLMIWFVYLYVFYMAREVIFDEEKSGLRLLFAIFFWFIGFSAIESFFTLYAVKHLGLSAGIGANLLTILPFFFVLFAIPSGYIAGRIGRRRTISIGLVIIILMMILLYVMPADVLLTGIALLPLLGIPLVEDGPRMLTIAGFLLSLAGIGWACININSLPMVVDLTGYEKIGTYTGLYYLFSTLAAIVGPIMNGVAIELTNNNYNIIMALAPVFFFIALLMILGVGRGEAKA